MSTPRSVHPHIRGAYVVHIRQLFRRDGSSPHTWGIPDIQPKQRSNVRFIPTYVGHTASPEIRRTRGRFIPTYVGHTLDRRKKNGWFQPLLL